MSKIQLNVRIGDSDLCAWAVAPGVTWVQTRNPTYARKLSQRADASIVAKGVHGGYLRTFEFKHPVSWAERLINRYTSAAKAANEAKNTPNARA